MNYVTYDEHGKLTGSYSQEVLDVHLENFIFVTEEQRANWTGYAANEARDGIEVAPIYTLSVEDAILVEKDRLFSEIAHIERDTLQNRGSRELDMRLLEREANQRAAMPDEVQTAEQILSGVPYYVKLWEVNEKIKKLREQLRLLSAPPALEVPAVEPIDTPIILEAPAEEAL